MLFCFLSYQSTNHCVRKWSLHTLVFVKVEADGHVEWKVRFCLPIPKTVYNFVSFYWCENKTAEEKIKNISVKETMGSCLKYFLLKEDNDPEFSEKSIFKRRLWKREMNFPTTFTHTKISAF